jgi:hypothetical protein
MTAREPSSSFQDRLGVIMADEEHPRMTMAEYQAFRGKCSTFACANTKLNCVKRRYNLPP